MYEIIAVLAAFAMVYSVVGERIERTWISGAIVFTAFGLIFGPFGLKVLSADKDPELLKSLAELTLALVLFADASGTHLGVLRKARALPIRLLAIGLPLTILLGFGVGKAMFPELSIFGVALLATMLAPTDAALGKAVVTNEAVPDPIRQGLNVESGLNDGICVPILFLFLMLAEGNLGDMSAGRAGLLLFGKVVGIGLACGVVLTLVAVWLLRLGRKHSWLSPTWTKITVVATAFACFGAAQWLGGSGFIASFVGGLLFGGLLEPHHEELLDAAEGIGDTFSLLTWVLFGSAVVGEAVGHFTWPVVVYALLSLTVIRMLPVFLVVTGLGMNTEAKLFTGWFGPRGLASIVFVVIVASEGVPGSGLLSMVVVCTVLGSIILHGVTANPWAKAFGARAERATE
ncbi:MAG: sodium:proton antiporter [Planctomycetes bacterium]|nr:sodium:proton antiporter [Planctomycetota bacterium]